MPPHLFLTSEHQLMVVFCGGRICTQIVAVVMVSENRENSVSGIQSLHNRYGRKQFVGVHVLQVSRKRYHICMLGIQRVDHDIQLSYASPDVTSHMGIAEKSNAIAVEGRRQLCGIVVHTANIHSLATEESTVDYQQQTHHSQHHAHSASVIAARPSLAFAPGTYQ